MYLIEQDRPLLCCRLRGRGHRPWVLEHCLLALVMWYLRAPLPSPRAVPACLSAPPLLWNACFLKSLWEVVFFS